MNDRPSKVWHGIIAPAVILLAIAAFLEAWFTLLAGWGTLAQWPVAMLLHPIAVAFMYGGFRIQRREEEEHPEQNADRIEISPSPESSKKGGDFYSTVAIPVGLFIPFFGIPAMLTMFFFCRRGHGNKDIFSDYLTFIEHRVTLRPTFQRIDPQEHTLQKLSVEPIVDALHSTDKAITRGSIEVLSRLADQNAIGLIRRTLDHPDMDVKFYSSWGLDQIEDEHLSTIKKLQAAREKDPNRENSLALLVALEQYLATGLVDEVTRTFHIAECSRLLQDTIKRWGPDRELLLAQAMVCKQEGALAKNVELLRLLDDEEPLPGRMRLDLAETLFRTGEFDEVTRIVEEWTSIPENEKLLHDQEIEVTMQTLREFWVGPENSAESGGIR